MLQLVSESIKQNKTKQKQLQPQNINAHA